MAEYIEKDAAIKALQLTCLYDSDNEERVMNFAFNHCREKITAIPAADVEPVVHARWECHLMPLALKCSRCECVVTRKQKTDYHYCPNCGAKMDGGGGT